MHDLYLIRRSELTYSDLAARLEAHRIDTLVDARPSDEPGDFSFSVLAALCSASGYGYLRRGDRLGTPPNGDREAAALAAAVGSLAELAKAGRVALLVTTDPGFLSMPSVANGLALRTITDAGTVAPYEDHLPID